MKIELNTQELGYILIAIDNILGHQTSLPQDDDRPIRRNMVKLYNKISKLSLSNV